MHRRAFIASAGLAFAARAIGADAPATGDLAGDIEILRRALTLHPGLHRYNSPRRIDARIDGLKRDFAAAPTLEARYLVLSRFLATIRCGHSYANFFNQKKAVRQALFAGPTRLPFRFAWIGGQMVVTGGDALPRGAVVRRIDGVAPDHMLAALMPYARADGHNDAKRVALLEVQGVDSIEYFDVFQGLLFPPKSDAFAVEATDPTGRPLKIQLAPIDLAARRAAAPPVAAGGDVPIWRWDERDGIAVLTMPSWALYDSKWDWRGWLDTRLDALAGKRGLIVDLRANEGGEDCGDRILARLIDRPFAQPATERRIRFQRTPADLDPYLDTWDDSFRTLGLGARPLANGFFLKPDAPEDLVITPAPMRLTLPVIALIGPTNSSATFQFARNLRLAGAGRLYGEPTGGNRRGINGGSFFFVRMPASGLEFDLPLVGEFPLTPQPDAGLMPDVLIPRTIAAIAAGRDMAMERALADLGAR